MNRGFSSSSIPSISSHTSIPSNSLSMSTSDLITKAQLDFDTAITHLKHEFSKLQIGRASAALVEDIHVDAYGSMTPMKGVASISIPDARTLAIQVWDRSLTGAVEKAILASNIGLTPTNDGTVIRLIMPALTEERRKDLVKVVGQLAEQAKISVRTARGSAHGGFKSLADKKEITEDEQRHSEKVLQEKVDATNRLIDETAKKKESDIMTI